jgi:hypothetical protein
VAAGRELQPPVAGTTFGGGSGNQAGGSNLGATLLAMVTALIGAILFIGALVVITAVFLVVIVTALCVLAVRGAVHALTPRSRVHPVDQSRFHPTAVIETTAKVIRSAAPKPRS